MISLHYSTWIRVSRESEWMNDTSDNWPVNWLAVVQIVIPTAELEHVGNHSYPYECALFIALLFCYYPRDGLKPFGNIGQTKLILIIVTCLFKKTPEKKIYARLRIYVIYIWITFNKFRIGWLSRCIVYSRFVCVFIIRFQKSRVYSRVYAKATHLNILCDLAEFVHFLSVWS